MSAARPPKMVITFRLVPTGTAIGTRRFSLFLFLLDALRLEWPWALAKPDEHPSHFHVRTWQAAVWFSFTGRVAARSRARCFMPRFGARSVRRGGVPHRGTNFLLCAHAHGHAACGGPRSKSPRNE